MKTGQSVASQQLTNLRTGAGQTSTASTSTDPSKQQRQQQSAADQADVIDAVNFAFMLMRDAFPQQFLNAFPSQESRDRARSLWARGLADLGAKSIKRAAVKAMKESKFLPTLSEIRRLCATRYEDLGLKDPLQAYYEACRATNRTREGHWSHIAVYLAARETGWQFLEGEPQTQVLPVFERNYEILCNRLVAGESLEGAIHMALENQDTLSQARKADAAAEKKLHSDMEKQGINPHGGRNEFLKVIDEL